MIGAPNIDVIHRAAFTMGSATPDSEALSDYIDSYRGNRSAESTRYLRTYPEQLATLGGLLPGIYTPVQIIAGRAD